VGRRRCSTTSFPRDIAARPRPQAPGSDHTDTASAPLLPTCAPGAEPAQELLRRRSSPPWPRDLRRQGQCQNCHMQPVETEAGWNLVEPPDICRRRHRQPLADAALPHDPSRGHLRPQQARLLPRRSLPTLMSVVEHSNSCHDLN
jgi:hypothetical protein